MILGAHRERGACKNAASGVRLCRMKSAPGRHGKMLNAEVSGTISISGSECPQKDSNLRTWLRRPVLYPLSYGGSPTEKGYQDRAAVVTRAPDALVLLSLSSANMPSLFRQHVEKGGTLTECDTRFGAGAR